MNYFPCAIHNGHMLSIICTDKSCNDTILICRNSTSLNQSSM